MELVSVNINFHVKNQIIKRTDKTIVVNKSKNILFADFIFDEEDWEGKHKFAIFKNETQAFTSSQVKPLSVLLNTLS